MDNLNSYITGIYNYCDRWCEKCAFTSKCYNYHMLEQEGLLETNDGDNKQFWDGLAASLQKTIELLHKIAKENNIDLENVEIDEHAAKKRNEAIENNHLIGQAKHYSVLVDVFFKNRKEQIQDSLAALGNEEKIKSIIGATDIIRWYQHFVHAKIDRAIGSALDETEHSDEFELNDTLGSAKVTLVSIERSMASWTIIYSHFPYMLDEIIPILAHLEKFKKGINAFFPKAQNFKRPGFDD